MAEGGFFRRRPPDLPEAFRALMDAAPEGLALLDPAGKILAANPALHRLAGQALAPHPGLPAARLVVSSARPALAERIAAAARGDRDPTALSAAPAAPDASADTSWSIACTPVAARSGMPPQVLLRVTDQTAELRRAAGTAAASRLETVGRLAGGIAHDFNNLLSVVLGSAEAARASGELTPEALAEIAQIEDAARRGAGLVKQILAFARQQRLAPRIIDANAAVRDIAPLLRRLLGERLRLELALDETARWVLVDPVQLDQVILNLAINAREAMPAGGTLRISTDRIVALRADGPVPAGRWVVLDVADTGAGIPPEVLPRLFEPFFTTRPDKGGTGLGLATVQGIVAQSGGHIMVDSRVGEGTRFRIHLPRQDPPAANPREAAVQPAAGPAGALILLVEDEAPLRRLGTRLLERAGYRVVAAETAEDALDLAETLARPAALLSDIAMPGMDGVELAQRLRERWPGVPVLLLSGYAERIVGGGLPGSGYRFLAKPYVAAELLAVLTAVIGTTEAVA